MIAGLRTKPVALTIGLALVMSQLASSNAAAKELAARVPADAILYIEWAGHDAIQAGGGKDSVFGRMMADPEFRRMLTAVGTAAQAAISQTVATGEPQAAMAGDIIELARVLWARPVVVALLGTELSLVGPVPQLVVAIDAGEASAGLQKQVEDLLANVPPFAAVRDEVIGSTTFKRYDPLVAVRLGVVDGVFWIMVGEATAEKTLAVSSGGAAALATSERYLAAMKKIGTRDRTPVATLHFDVVQALAAAKAMMAAMTGAEGFPPPVSALLEELGITSLQSVTLTEQIAGRGHRHSMYIASPGRKKGLLRLYDFDPITDQDLLAVPNDATFAKAANLRLSDVYDEAMRIVGAIGEVMPEVPQTVSAAVAQIEEQIGMKIKEDILDLFDDGWVVFDAPSSGGLIVTGITLVVETKDAEKVDRLIRRGLETVAGLIDPTEAFTVKSYEHKGKAIGFVNITAGPSPVAPAWAFHEDRLVLALYPQMVTQVIDRLSSPAAASLSILENPDFVRARKLLPKECSTIAYMDTRKGVSDLYSIALPLVSAGCSFAQGQGIPLDISAWPRREVFTRDLFGDGWGVASDADGVLIVGQGPWPIPVLPAAAFGPALMGAALSGAMVAANQSQAVFQPVGQPLSDAAPEMEYGAQVTAKLEQISVALQLYALEHKEQFPPDLDALLAGGNLTPEDLQAPEGFPEFVYLSGQTLKMDAHNVLVYWNVWNVDFAERLRDLGYLEGDAEDALGGDCWVLTLDGSVQQVSEAEFQAMLEATQQRLGR